ncbi:SMC-Scp complex subunit ScpB [Spiroplasma endosymbiont of Aspidapion aeneum]|uniref:SMC-Scp complex subunit ScpB n=1 Tax=Spiroplasma endosymbiont of Aspidapion aeneum TaxID=3066276 RepID=UPI00313ED561
MNNNKLMAVVEGLLFLNGDAGVDIEDIKQMLNINEKDEVVKIINNLNHKYKNDDSCGLMIQTFAQTKFRMVIKNAFFDYYLKLENIKTEAKLSSAAIEVLSLIAYRGPISKPEVEQIRGVNCDIHFSKLRQRGLIAENGKAENLVGKPMLYITTDDFLKYFNLNSLDELPPLTAVEENEDIF